jgi:hypothetical protein
VARRDDDELHVGRRGGALRRQAVRPSQAEEAPGKPLGGKRRRGDTLSWADDEDWLQFREQCIERHQERVLAEMERLSLWRRT